MKHWTRLLLRSGVALALAVCAGVGSAQGWPAKPIHIVAPVPPGGGVDFLARAIAQKLQAAAFEACRCWSTTRPARALLVGHRLRRQEVAGRQRQLALLMGYSVLATNKFLVNNLPYDLERDLVPVA